MVAVAVRKDTDAWLDARRGYITSSAIPVILGLSPYRCEQDLADEMSGTAPRSIHVVADGPDLRDHTLSGTCPCIPLPGHDIAEPSRLVFMHRRRMPEPPKETKR